MKKRATVLVGVALAFVFTTAETCQGEPPKAPKTGKVTDISYLSRACYDQGDAGVALSYQPAGTDKTGAHWPITFVCVTEETAAKYKVGQTYP